MKPDCVRVGAKPDSWCHIETQTHTGGAPCDNTEEVQKDLQSFEGECGPAGTLSPGS